MNFELEYTEKELAAAKPAWGRPAGRSLALGEDRLSLQSEMDLSGGGKRRLTIASRPSLESVQGKTETLLERSKTINLHPRFG